MSNILTDAECERAVRAVELYREMHSFRAVAEALGINEHTASRYVHDLAPRLAQRTRWYRHEQQQFTAPGQCRRCGILLEEIGDTSHAKHCRWCQQELAHIRQQARKATGKAARFYAEYLERGEWGA